MTALARTPLRRKKPLTRGSWATSVPQRDVGEGSLKNKRPAKKGGSWFAIRRDPLRILWSKIVRARDSFTCQKCGKTEREGQIDAAHILGAGAHSNLKFLVNNGISLCTTHHKEFDLSKTRSHDGPGDQWAREKVGWMRYDALLILAKTYHRPGKVEQKIILKELAQEYGVV